MPEAEAYEAARIGRVPFFDVAGTFEAETGRSCLLVLNRDQFASR